MARGGADKAPINHLGLPLPRWSLLQLPPASAEPCLPDPWTHISLEGVWVRVWALPTPGKPRPGDRLFLLRVTQGSSVGSGLAFVLGAGASGNGLGLSLLLSDFRAPFRPSFSKAKMKSCGSEPLSPPHTAGWAGGPSRRRNFSPLSHP